MMNNLPFQIPISSLKYYYGTKLIGFAYENSLSIMIRIPLTYAVIGTVYLNIPLSSASIHGHPRSSLGATLGVRMSVTAYGNLSTVSSVWPIGAARLNLRPRTLSI